MKLPLIIGATALIAAIAFAEDSVDALDEILAEAEREEASENSTAEESSPDESAAGDAETAEEEAAVTADDGEEAKSDEGEPEKVAEEKSEPVKAEPVKSDPAKAAAKEEEPLVVVSTVNAATIEEEPESEEEADAEADAGPEAQPAEEKKADAEEEPKLKAEIEPAVEAKAEPAAEEDSEPVAEAMPEPKPTVEEPKPAAARAKVKSMTIEGTVIPPSTMEARTLEDAIRNIIAQAGKQAGAVSTNGIDKLTMDYQQLGDGKTYKVEWRKALRQLLSPVGYSFTEDDELVLFGLSEEVAAKHKVLAQERLIANHTPILFTASASEGGMELKLAILDVATKAGITISTDYMDPKDLVVPSKKATAGELSAGDVAKAAAAKNAKNAKGAPGAAGAQAQTQVPRTSFNTNGQQIEWRIVLREILNPKGYDFAEIGGIVRIAKRTQLKQWESEALAKKPLTAKIIRLYHADPESVVERLKQIKGLLKHPDASLQATRKKSDDSEVVKNLNSRIQTGSGQKSGQSDTTSQVFNKLVRPRTVPAIIVYDIAENLPVVEKKVKLFDIKEKQILIEAIIFQLDTNNGADGEMDGFKWEGFEQYIPLMGGIGNAAYIADAVSQWSSEYKYGVDDDGNTIKTLVNEGQKLTDHAFNTAHGRNAYVRTDGIDFHTVIQLIRERENTKLLASPMLVVGDHSQAAIQVSDVDPIPQIDASSVSSLASSSDNVQNSVNIQWNMVRSGILMWVAPEITESGNSVRLTVHPQVVTKGEKKDLSSLGGIFKQYPVYNYELKMHEMDTRATVPTGATLMFGGLVDNSEVEVEDKVRWLGDIPIIGWLFRSKTKITVQKNLIIMIRPTILEDDDLTGFEKNALKESKPMMKSSGRDLKATQMEGPLHKDEIKENIKTLYHDRVVAPFEDRKKSKGGSPHTTAPEQEDDAEIDDGFFEEAASVQMTD